MLHNKFTPMFMALLVGSTTALNAQGGMMDLDSLFNAQSQLINQERDAFNEETDRMMQEYNDYVEGMMAEHKAFQEEIASKWGDDEAVESSQKVWVEYNGDQDSRSVVDFESGDVLIEVLLSPEDIDADGNIVEEKMQAALAAALSSRGQTSDYDSKYSSRQPISDTSILSGLVDLSSYGIDLSNIDATRPAATTAPPTPTVGGALAQRGTAKESTSTSETMVERQKRAKKGATTVPTPTIPTPTIPTPTIPTPTIPTPTVPTPTIATTTPAVPVATPVATPATPAPQIEEKIEAAAAQVAQSAKPVIQEKVQEDGTKKIVATIQLKLSSDHVSQRAAQYSDIISKYSQKFSIDEPIIYAIMEQESAFNPVAKSWVPAYGLMQLVPSSGGRDAYNYVYKEDKIVSGEYLFNPDQNIELGAAYLKILRTRNFPKVTDPKCQLLCMVAAYNCGAGNVSRAIIGNTNLPKAIPDINKMSYDQLYNHFRSHLPDETKDYIYKITRNIEKYTK